MTGTRDIDRREAAVAVSGLRKSYGQLEAVRGVTFEVRRDEIFALLGPNGAGKTTMIEILEGYRRRSLLRCAPLPLGAAHSGRLTQWCCEAVSSPGASPAS